MSRTRPGPAARRPTRPRVKTTPFSYSRSTLTICGTSANKKKDDETNQPDAWHGDLLFMSGADAFSNARRARLIRHRGETRRTFNSNPFARSTLTASPGVSASAHTARQRSPPTSTKPAWASEDHSTTRARAPFATAPRRKSLGSRYKARTSWRAAKARQSRGRPRATAQPSARKKRR